MDSMRIAFCRRPASDAPRRAQVPVDAHLAACANVLPGARAAYRWRGDMVHAEKAVPLVETTRAQLEALLSRVQARLPNVLPDARAAYRWRGDMVHAEKAVPLVETTRAQLEALLSRVQARPRHERPEVVAVEASGGLRAGLDRIAAATSPEPMPESST